MIHGTNSFLQSHSFQIYENAVYPYKPHQSTARICKGVLCPASCLFVPNRLPRHRNECVKQTTDQPSSRPTINNGRTWGGSAYVYFDEFVIFMLFIPSKNIRDIWQTKYKNSTEDIIHTYNIIYIFIFYMPTCTSGGVDTGVRRWDFVPPQPCAHSRSLLFMRKGAGYQQLKFLYSPLMYLYNVHVSMPCPCHILILIYWIFMLHTNLQVGLMGTVSRRER